MNREELIVRVADYIYDYPYLETESARDTALLIIDLVLSTHPTKEQVIDAVKGEYKASAFADSEDELYNIAIENALDAIEKLYGESE